MQKAILYLLHDITPYIICLLWSMSIETLVIKEIPFFNLLRLSFPHLLVFYKIYINLQAEVNIYAL